MPELPEVEVAARNLAHWARGRRVRALATADRRSLAGTAPKALSALVGARLTVVDRIGKNLLLSFESGSGRAKKTVGVWSHLGMTGKWLRRGPNDAPPRFSRVRIDFAGGPTLHFVDMRLFGFFRLVPGAEFTAMPVLAALGPDPLREGIDAGRLAKRLARLSQPIKLPIMDQALIPGVGNIQASEALYRAGIDPRRAAKSLGATEVARLARAILASFQYTLRAFAAAGVLPPDASTKATAKAKATAAADADIEYVEEPGTGNPFRVYDRAGERCRRCRRGTITRIVQGGRSTYFCPACQK